LLAPFALGLILFFIIILDKELRYQHRPPYYFAVLLAAVFVVFLVAVIMSKKSKMPPLCSMGNRLSKLYSKLSLWSILLILILLLLLYIFTTKGGRIGSDGYFYFSYLHSIYFDGDLDFYNEYNHFGLFRFSYLKGKTPTGLYHNVFSIGPALLWTPFYLTAHTAVFFYNLLGGEIEADGFSYPYATAVTFGSLVFGFLGLLIIYSILKRYFSSSLSFLTVITVLFGSFIIWYMVYEPSMSHSLSFFASSLFIFLWIRDDDKSSLKYWLLLGISAGLMAAIRWQNALFLLLPAAYGVAKGILFLREKNYRKLKRLILNVLIFLFPIFLLFIPQMIVWKSLYGAFLTVPQQSKVLWHRPEVWDLLFSSRHGLLSWTPMVYLSLIGLGFFFKKEKFLIANLSVVFIIMIYLNSIIQDWWAGWAFGSRRFASCLPIFALGFAALMDFLLRRPKILLSGFLIILIGWNLMFMMQFKRGEVLPDQPISFAEVAQRQVESVHAKAGYPFSFPANLIFSLKYGVSPGKYDLLVGRYFYQPTINVGADDEIYIGRGWSYPQVERKNVGFRWSNAWESTLLIPLQSPQNYQFSMQMWPYWVEGLPRQTVEIWINGTFLNRITLKQEPSLYSINAPSNYWKRRINEIKFRYRYIASPAETVGSKDLRRIGIAVDYIKLKIIK
jgi:hypothetical protein